MIYKTINNGNELQREFQEYNRDHYSIEAYDAMIQLFTETDTNFELDVIALCCDFNEDSDEDILDYYEVPEDKDILEWMQDRTYAVRLDNGNIFYQVF